MLALLLLTFAIMEIGCHPTDSVDTNEDMGEKNWTVPPTGQDKCYDDDSEIPCPGTAGSPSCASTDFCGQDAQYAATRTFTVTTKRGKNLLEDSATGLMWMQEYAKDKTWQEAIDYCDALDYGGHTDWRLPSLIELWTLTNTSHSSLIDDTIFSEPSGEDSSYWSFDAWIVSSASISGHAPHHGPPKVLNILKDWIFPVRCARNGPLKIGSFEPLVISSYRVVKDLGTGLMWQGCSAGQSGADCTGDEATRMSWKEALSYCEGLTWAGHDDWRLPNIHELQSIVDYGKGELSLDFTAFPLAPYNCWSSSSYKYSNSIGHISFNYGYTFASNAQPTDGRYARCVRSEQ